MRARVVVACLAGVLVVLGVVLWTDNPTVDVDAADLGSTAHAGDVDCSIAPWDAVLNGNDDGPGGEHARAYVDEVASDCWSANRSRFCAGVGCGVLGLLLCGLSGITRGATGSARRRPPRG